MQIVYRTGDFIDGAEPVAIHSCNARGVMGAGAALAVRERLPFAYTAYRNAYCATGLHLGEVVWAIDIATDARPRIVGNAITQQAYGRGPQRYVDYEAVRTAIRHVEAFVAMPPEHVIAAMPPLDAVAMPLIGCGLGGGSWSIISAIVEEESHSFTPVVYLLDGIIPSRSS